MKVSLTLDSFPMSFFDMFKNDLAKYIQATIQVGGGDTVFVNFGSDDIVKVQEACIICDKYAFAKGGVLYGEEKEDSS